MQALRITSNPFFPVKAQTLQIYCPKSMSSNSSSRGYRSSILNPDVCTPLNYKNWLRVIKNCWRSIGKKRRLYQLSNRNNANFRFICQISGRNSKLSKMMGWLITVLCPSNIKSRISSTVWTLRTIFTYRLRKANFGYSCNKYRNWTIDLSLSSSKSTNSNSITKD